MQVNIGPPIFETDRKEQTSQRAQKKPCHPKTLVTACPKKGGHDAYPLSHELQIQIVNSKMWTVCSKFEPSAPILNHELQLSTVSSNSEPWAPIINCELQFWTKLHQTYSQIHKNLQIELSKMSRDSVQIHYSFFIIYYMYFIFIIYYFILYVFYFYYMLFYII